MIGAEVFQKKMEGMTVILMAQMTQFVKKDIVLKDLRKSHYLQIKVDVALCRTTSPVADIILYGNTVIYESVSRCEFC